MKDIFWWEPKISKHKAICLQLSWVQPRHIDLGCEFDSSWKDDHAGFALTISLFKIMFHFNFYDIRHWDDEKDQWVIYEEDKE